MNWQFWLLGYLFFIVVFYQGYKAAVQHARRDGAATILLQLVASISILLVVPFFDLQFPTDLRVWGLLILATVFYALNDRLNTTARKHLQVSTYAIISQLSTVFLMTIGFTIFRETFVAHKALGAGLIILGNVLLVYKKGKFELNKYFAFAVLASVMISIALSIDIGISQNFNLPAYIFITLFVPAIMILVAERIKISEVTAEYNSKERKYYLITGMAWGLAILSLLRAYQLGGVTTVVPLSGLSVLLNVLVAYIVFNEREDRLKKLIAAGLAVIGVWFTV